MSNSNIIQTMVKIKTDIIRPEPYLTYIAIIFFSLWEVVYKVSYIFFIQI